MHITPMTLASVWIGTSALLCEPRCERTYTFVRRARSTVRDRDVYTMLAERR